MSTNLRAALADCLDRMRRGESLDACLARYPEHASELRGLLSLAGDVRRVPAPRARPEARAAGRARMLAAADARPEPGSVARLRAWLALPPALRWGVAVLAVLTLVLGSGWLSVTSSAGSLPGDWLYPVKRANERIQMWLTFDEAAEQQLEAEFARERLDETRSVLTQRRQAVVEFEGELEEVEAGYWIVDGLTVHLTADSRIEGEPLVGAWVQVRARSQADGRLLALRLRVRPPRPVPAAPATPSPSPTPTATPTLSPTPTATPSPSPSRRPSRTPRPSATPSPAPRATRALQPRQTHTPEPSATPPARTPRSPAEPSATPHPRPRPTESRTPHPPRTPTPPSKGPGP